MNITIYDHVILIYDFRSYCLEIVRLENSNKLTVYFRSNTGRTIIGLHKSSSIEDLIYTGYELIRTHIKKKLDANK